MKNAIHSLLVTLISVTAALLCSCGNVENIKQNVSGSPGEIIVVINAGEWDSEVGEILRNDLEAEYQVLPQIEPKFKLYNINPDNFSSLFWIHRNILIVNISPDVEEDKTLITKDVWAAPQTVVKVNAKDRESAIKLLREDIELIDNTFEQAERDRIIANNIKYQEANVRQVVGKMTGGSPYFPMGFTIKKNDGKFIWISYETTYVSQYVFVFKYPATSLDDLTVDRIISESNAALRLNVPGPVEDSYMITAALPDPQIKFVKYQKRDFAEVRGLWEVQNDYMGGPYVIHAFYDRSGENVIVLMGFVYAPKFDKRNYMRQVESIMYSFEWMNLEEK